ncbi:MAG: hypothetical protein GTO51_10020 [Candidatus Latescibacteria bacterium]|nr:hypothetical protein [Candidatus Latescibacterota bacterium]NIM66304.1 hypothetical protein [Candidatus Latescibacterota bacterium]NIO02783.1 hypothetical protein [Candidatus Latescibacterota bacterium]NIO29918.1 hypothetical protein [Candidatus Latescibacterota bacterium]NIO57533.1 hypothetical protein [Candidatus Latescibacterota bacterium]
MTIADFYGKITNDSSGEVTVEKGSKQLTVVVALLLIATLPNAALSVTFQIEAENYVDSLDLAFELIRPVDGGTGCSGGYYLAGLDAPGEWTLYDLNVSASGVYAVKMKIRGDEGISYQFQLIFTGNESGETQTITCTFVAPRPT